MKLNRLALLLFGVCILNAALLARAGDPVAPVPQKDSGSDRTDLFSITHTNNIKLAPGPEDSRIARLVARLLERQHYKQQPFSREVADAFLDRYLNALDPQHLYFLQSDVKEFSAYKEKLDSLTLRYGDTSPGDEIFNRFLQRFEEQARFVMNLLQSETMTFTNQERFVFNRKEAPRPANDSEARNLWRQRLRYEFLQEKLGLGDGEIVRKTIVESLTQNPKADLAGALKDKLGKERLEEVLKLVKANQGGKPEALGAMVKDKLLKERDAEVVKVLTRRHQRQWRALREFDSDDVLQVYLTALAHVYDPHSDYMGKAALENFSIGMKLSLVGIGALLQSEDGYCKIRELMPGPAQRSKLLKPGDKILAVAQGGQDPVDVVDMKLNKVVDMIRGAKGTEVRLTVAPVDAPDPSYRKIVNLIRDEIKLEDQEAKAKVVDVPQEGGKPLRLGVIDLPSFYAGFVVEGRDAGNDTKSTTTDVLKLLTKLKEEHVQGVILDLRRNGGGSLEEAITLTGLFIKDGPVVQVRDPDGNRVVDRDRDPAIAYDGPLMVLTSRFSASASEILAAALQDYGRALIVGDSTTFGKGTVQTLQQLAPFMRQMGIPFTNNPGALKFTIRKFYRASGGSTQLRGVTPDVILPSLNNHADVGEASEDNALAWDEVPSATFKPVDYTKSLKDEVRQRSEKRIASSADFKLLLEEIVRFKKLQAEKSVSLNEEERLKEKQDAEARVEARKLALKKRPASKETVYEVNLKNVNLPGLKTAAAVAAMKEEADAPDAKPRAINDPEDEGEATPPDETNGAVDITLDEAKRIMMDLIALWPRSPDLAASDAKSAR